MLKMILNNPQLLTQVMRLVSLLVDADGPELVGLSSVFVGKGYRNYLRRVYGRSAVPVVFESHH